MSKYYAWGERELIAELEKRDNQLADEKEHSELLARENKAMAEKLSALGYTNAQISDICNGAM